MITHLILDTSDKTKSKSLVTLEDGTEVVVFWWYSLTNKAGESFVQDCLLAEAYVANGDKDSALGVMSPKATGSLVVNNFQDANGEVCVERTDTRNFYQNWIDNNI
jgi:hypothetical protein